MKSNFFDKIKIQTANLQALFAKEKPINEEATPMILLLELLANGNRFYLPENMLHLKTLAEEASGKLKQRADAIYRLLQADGLKISTNGYDKAHLENIDKELINSHLQHPAERKGKLMDKLQTWVAKEKLPDFSIIKAYSDLLNPLSYPDVFAMLADACYVFGLEGVEAYIAHGKKSLGITAFEAKPSFLVVGNQHLNRNSPHYMSPLELLFAMASELAHLYFKHSNISTNDLWAGAKDKGLFMFDTILALVPLAGVLPKALNRISKLNAVNEFLRKAEKIGSLTSKSKDLINSSLQVVDFYKGFSKKMTSKDKKEQELLAISRLMQLTADRAGLVFTDDITASVRAIFLKSDSYRQYLPFIERHGIHELLLQKNKNGTYKHIEIAIRLSALFSFYLSEEFDVIMC